MVKRPPHIKIVRISKPVMDKAAKFVWRACKEGGQEFGNKQIICDITFSFFIHKVLPGRKKYYKGKTERDKYKDFLKKEGYLGISFINQGFGWHLIKIDHKENLFGEIEYKKRFSWVKQVRSFESKTAERFRRVADSDLRKKQCLNYSKLHN